MSHPIYSRGSCRGIPDRSEGWQVCKETDLASRKSLLVSLVCTKKCWWGSCSSGCCVAWYQLMWHLQPRFQSNSADAQDMVQGHWTLCCVLPHPSITPYYLTKMPLFYSGRYVGTLFWFSFVIFHSGFKVLGMKPEGKTKLMGNAIPARKTKLSS